MSTTDTDLAALRDDFAGLKRDVLSLMENLKSDATVRARVASGQVSDGAQQIFDTVSAGSDWSAKAIGEKVEAQPVAALLIALGIGYIGGRVLFR